MTSDTAYRAGVAVAVGTALFLLWGMGALGIIGVEGDPADRMYYGVLAIGISGALVAWFEPDGMARTMLVTAAATMVVGVIALMLGKHQAEYSSAPEILGLTGMFATLFAASAMLFRKAASKRRSSRPESEDWTSQP